jgi:hypothetical protein
MAARLSALHPQDSFFLRFLVLISIRGLVDPRAIVRSEGLGKFEKIHLIGTRSRDLPACSIMQLLCYRVPPNIHYNMIESILLFDITQVTTSLSFCNVHITIRQSVSRSEHAAVFWSCSFQFPCCNACPQNDACMVCVLIGTIYPSHLINILYPIYHLLFNLGQFVFH